MAEAEKKVLVSTDWARQNEKTDGVRLVEVDVDTRAYETGHLPGAVAWNWKTELQDAVLRDIVQKDDFQQLLRDSGISNDTTIVLYGDNNNWFAAWAYWLLKYYGHDDVRIVDGGRKKLEAEGDEFTTDVPDYPAGNYTIAGVRDEYRAFRDDVKKHIEGSRPRLVDVRSPDEFTGKILAPPGLNETAQRGGHIPGAKNIPWSTAVNEDGTFKSPEELEEIYGGRGITRDGEVITYCRIGERSSHSWFVLKELLGYENVRNYDGSWTEWGNLVGAPIEKGAPPE